MPFRNIICSSSGNDATVIWPPTGGTLTMPGALTVQSLLTVGISGISGDAGQIRVMGGSTSGAIITFAGVTADRTITLPDVTGALLSTGAAVTAAQGGTGITSYAVGDLIYASGATTLSKLADVAVGSYLRSGGVTTAPLWSTLKLPNTAVIDSILYASTADNIGVFGSTAMTRGLITDPLDLDYMVLRDDFIGGGHAGFGGQNTIGELGWTGASLTGAATIDYIDAVANHPGIFRMTTNTSDNDGALLTFMGTSGSEAGRFPPLNALTGWKVRMVIRLSSAASVGLRCGLALDTNAVGAPAAGIYWQFDTDLSDSFFSAVCRSASTETKTASAVAGDTNWHVIDIFSNTSGTISFQIDGGTAIDITTNVPTIAMTPYFSILTRTTAAKTLDVDSWGAILTVSR
jgi:hypothetical protein